MADSTTSKTPANSMAELMARQSKTPVILHRGDSVTGKITKLTKNEILINIEGKSEAVVFEKDPRIVRQLLSMLHVGDEVQALVLHAESDSGQPVLTLRRYIEKKLWDIFAAKQKGREVTNVTVTESTKGGYIVATESGLSGFLPQSYTTMQQGALTPGKVIPVTIVELNKDENKIIVSQKHAMSDEDFKALTATFKTGQKIVTKVLQVTTFGVFVSLPGKDGEQAGIDGLIHISEISWEKVDDLASKFQTGQTIDAVIIGIDKDSKRIDLSIKRLSSDPFEKTKENFPLEKKVEGKVLRVEDGNVILDLGVPSTGSGQGRVEGMIKKEKVPPATTYAEGQMVTATVSAIDTRRRRIELTPVLKEKPLMYR